MTLEYTITIEGVDGTDAMYTLQARNCHVARRVAVDRWNSETNNQPILSIITE